MLILCQNSCFLGPPSLKFHDRTDIRVYVIYEWYLCQFAQMIINQRIFPVSNFDCLPLKAFVRVIFNQFFSFFEKPNAPYHQNGKRNDNFYDQDGKQPITRSGPLILIRLNRKESEILIKTVINFKNYLPYGNVQSKIQQTKIAVTKI